MSDQPTVVLYMPVIHRGYLDFLQKFSQQPILVLADDITTQFKPLRKDIRSLSAEQIVEALQTWNIGSEVSIATTSQIEELNNDSQQIVMPDEEPMQQIAQQYFPDAVTKFESVFLRWDSKKAMSTKSLDENVKTTNDEAHQQFMGVARAEASKSVDQWRQVGAVLVKQGKVVLKNRNRHLPDDYQPAFNGDPRGNFSKGQHIDLSTAQHAEAGIVAEAAKKGIALEGCDLYLTTFPCPVCAKLVSETGIKTVFFADGYSMVDGLRVLEDAGIEVERVEVAKVSLE